MKFDLYTQKGEKKGSAEGSDQIFKIPVNEELMRLHLVMQLANGRQVTAHTKTRAEVRGGGRKPWKQKGTGRARAGSIRSSIWVGGGATFGPRNTRNFDKSMNKKARRLALFSGLSQKAANSLIFALDQYDVKAPKTKDFATFLAKLPVQRSLLIIQSESNENLEKSVSNMPNVKAITLGTLNLHDLMKYESVMFMESALKKAEEIYLS